MNYNKLVLSYGVYNLKYYFTYKGGKYARVYFYAAPLAAKLAQPGFKRGWCRWYTDGV